MKVSIYIDGFKKSSILLQPWHHIYEVTSRMVKKGISVRIYTGNKKQCRQMININGVNVFRMYDFNLSNILLKTKSVTKLLLRDDADVLVWCGTPLSFFYLTRLKTLKKPIILSLDKDILSLFDLFKRISLREFFFPHHKLFWYQILISISPRFLYRKIANSSLISKIIVPSQYIRNRLLKIGIKKHKISIIPSTTDKNEFSINFEKSIQNLGRKASLQSEFIITYMGSPCTLRGPDTVIQSIPIILKKYKDIKLLILSRRTSNLMEELYLKKLIKKLNIESNVKIISGILKRKDLVKYINMSNVIVLPFKILESEFPVSTLEVMSIGKVVIASNIGTLTEILKNDCGILVEPNDPLSIAKKIIMLIENPDIFYEISKNAKDYVKNHDDWDGITQKTINVINNILK